MSIWRIHLFCVWGKNFCHLTVPCRHNCNRYRTSKYQEGKIILRQTNWFPEINFAEGLDGCITRKQQSLQDENSPVSLFNFHCSFQEKSMSGGSCETSTPTGLVIWYDPLNIFYAFCETVGWVIYIYHYFSVIFEKVASHIKSVIYSPWCPAQLTSAMMWCCLETKHEEMVPNIIFRLKGI